MSDCMPLYARARFLEEEAKARKQKGLEKMRINQELVKQDLKRYRMLKKTRKPKKQETDKTGAEKTRNP